MKAIQVNELTRQYGAYTAVDHITFSAEQGQLIGFLGVNGAGKSTTINMMSTLLTPTSGSIEICGADVQQESRLVREKIGIVYQNNVRDDLLTVRENLLCSSRTGRTADRVSVQWDTERWGWFFIAGLHWLFYDGNGRVGRLLALKMCLANDVVPFYINDDSKMFYYMGLKEWQVDGNKERLLDVFLSMQDDMKCILDYFEIEYDQTEVRARDLIQKHTA
ncbi:MAG: ATP-binding cassette domain-containing protein [Oscillospiraceae bacterium]|nr:ATP-binding cassette domain-containing protein [Oscillospiraceae bacterium]